MTDLTPDQTNQIIHEARGLCWHKWIRELVGDKLLWVCTCGELHYAEEHDPLPGINPEYTSDGSAYLEAIGWAMKKEWWREFLKDISFHAITFLQHRFDLDIFATILLTPNKGSTALAKFITEHPKCSKRGG